MVGNQMAGDSITSNLAGMSKNQLYDIMSQMKTLIEQNQQQARQILVDNPALTKALFQAQIMLGMVQPPKEMPNIQQTLSQSSQQATPTAQQLNVQSQPMPVQVGLQEPASATQPQIQARMQQENQPLLPIPSTSIPQVSLQSQTMPSHHLQSLQQPKGHLNAQGSSMSLPPTSQIHSMPPLSHHSAPQPPSLLQSQVPIVSAQLQQLMHSSGTQHMPLQPPLPPQPRPPAMQPPFQHQIQSQMGPHMGFQTSGAPQPHLSQPPFNSGKPPGRIGSSFPPQVQPPLLNQLMPQSMYQVGGPRLGAEFNGHPGSSMQVDRPSWMPGLPENAAGSGGNQLPGPPPLPGQMGLPNQPIRPPQLTPEMEKALLQQVMSLTPEQINLLPLEQRSQVFQLQQMLR